MQPAAAREKDLKDHMHRKEVPKVEKHDDTRRTDRKCAV